MAHNRFKTHSAAYKCHACGKLTRDTGHDEGTLELCKRCLFEAYVENALSDYGENSEEHRAAVAALAALPAVKS
jgi:hypothetical protein